MLRPSPLSDRVGNSIVRFEATPRFAHAAARRFARLPFGAFVRKLNASGYPLHLPQAMWVNYRIPTAGLQPASHTFYTAYPTNFHNHTFGGSKVSDNNPHSSEGLSSQTSCRTQHFSKVGGPRWNPSYTLGQRAKATSSPSHNSNEGSMAFVIATNRRYNGGRPHIDYYVKRCISEVRQYTKDYVGNNLWKNRVLRW